MTNIVTDMTKGRWFMANTVAGTVCYCHPSENSTIAEALQPISEMIGNDQSKIYSVKVSNTDEVLRFMNKMEKNSLTYSSAYH